MRKDFYVLLSVPIVLMLLALVYKLKADWASAAQADSPVHLQEDIGVVTITVKGRELIRIDEDGLHVTGDVTYTGTIVDEQPAPQPSERDGQ